MPGGEAPPPPAQPLLEDLVSLVTRALPLGDEIRKRASVAHAPAELGRGLEVGLLAGVPGPLRVEEVGQLARA